HMSPPDYTASSSQIFASLLRLTGRLRSNWPCDYRFYCHFCRNECFNQYQCYSNISVSVFSGRMRRTQLCNRVPILHLVLSLRSST
ncbi:unnamed protein product, partial [Lampetra planeri]